MGKVTVEYAEEPQVEEQLWFLSKGNRSIYRRGPDGLCIEPDGTVSVVSNRYVGATWDVFENPEYYTPLKKGDKIIIEL